MMVEKQMTLLLKKIFIALVIAACCFGFLPGQPANAQSQTILAVEPQESEVPLGNQIVLELTVTLGLNINAFDLTVVYVPQVLSFEIWENGVYLKNLASVNMVDDPGTFRLAVTQLAQPSVSGDGVLIALTFNSAGAGESTLNLIDVAFADSQGNLIEPETADGMVAVTLSPTFTPTPTPTQTPTTKPTLTPTTGPGGGTAYPVKNDVTATPTTMVSGNSDEGAYALPGGEEQVGTAYPENTDPAPIASGQDEAVTAYPDQSAGNEPGENGSNMSGENEGADGSGQIADTSAAARSGLNGFLWIVLIIAILAMAGMTLIAIRRKRNKGKDLLL